MNADLTLEHELSLEDLDPTAGLQRAAKTAGRIAGWSLTATAAALFGVGLSVVMGIGSLVVAALAVVCVVACGVVLAALLLVLAAACVVAAGAALATSALTMVGALGLWLASLTQRGLRHVGSSAERLGRMRGRVRAPTLPRQATSSAS